MFENIIALVLPKVKARMGIYYDDMLKDAEISELIECACDAITSSGVSLAQLSTPLAVDTIAIYCQLRQSNDPTQTAIHPVYNSNIIILRNRK